MKNTKENHLPIIVTVDGPVGSGKGSLAAMLAKYLNFNLLDSGALYRVLALAISRHNLDLNEQQKIEKLATSLNIQFVSHKVGEPASILLDNQDVSDEIRQEKCGDIASKISGYPAVRSALMQLQKDFVRAPGLVADGRDMGTIVFPDAKVKFYLTASQEIRAKRRLKQLQNIPNNINQLSYEQLLLDIQRRDERDMNRPIAPLKPALNAIIIDSSDMTMQQVFEKMVESISLLITV